MAGEKGNDRGRYLTCGPSPDSEEDTNMAHVLDGDWRSKIMSRGEELEDGTFHFEVAATGQLRLPQSTHDGQPLASGNVFSTALNHITLTDDRGNDYEGILLLRPQAIGTPLMVLCGRRKLNVVRPFDDTQADDAGKAERERERGREAERFFDQENAVWVATKTG
jgi:hypothetical protein